MGGSNILRTQNLMSSTQQLMHNIETVITSQSNVAYECQLKKSL